METKICQNCKNSFTIESDDFLFYEKMKVPPPTFCPQCRMAKLLAFRNVRSLYRRNCDLCSKVIITMYRTDDPAPIYCNECWKGDQWDAALYAMNYDPSRQFFEQWHELFQKVPRFALWKVGTLLNSDYTNYSLDNKDCYFSYSVLRCENVRYSENIDDSKNTLDSLYVKNTEWCYEVIDSHKNYNCSFLFESRDCIDSSFLYDCAKCQNCFMSSNLRNKQYVFRGQQLTKEEYKQRILVEDIGTHTYLNQLKKEFKQLRQNAIHKFADILGSNNVTGNHIVNAKNVKKSFSIYNAEDIIRSIRVFSAKEVLDTYGATEAELIYYSISCSFGAYDNRFVILCEGNKNIEYSTQCNNCSDLFGCVGLKNKKYCILNKEYPKEEYEKLVSVIKQEMINHPYIDASSLKYPYGEFFPAHFSPFTYGETLASDFYPKTKEQTQNAGFRWVDPAKKEYQITHYSSDLPDSITDVDETILQAVIECEHKGECTNQCTQAFRIFSEDLQFYKKMNLPLPRLCPNCRHYERLKMRTPVSLWHRGCSCEQAGHFHGESHCSNEFETSYAADRPEKVYCEQCYQAEVL